MNKMVYDILVQLGRTADEKTVVELYNRLIARAEEVLGNHKFNDPDETHAFLHGLLKAAGINLALHYETEGNPPEHYQDVKNIAENPAALEFMMSCLAIYAALLKDDLLDTLLSQSPAPLLQ